MFLEQAWINSDIPAGGVCKYFETWIYFSTQPASQPARREFKRVELRNFYRSELLIGQGVKYKYTNKYTNTKHEYLSTSQAWMLNWENFRFVNSCWGLLHLISPQCLFDFVWTEKCLEVKFVDWSRCWTQTWLLPGRLVGNTNILPQRFQKIHR